MAKEHKRSNREVRKPKKKKEPVAPPGALVIKDIKTTIKKKKD